MRHERAGQVGGQSRLFRARLVQLHEPVMNPSRSLLLEQRLDRVGDLLGVEIAEEMIGAVEHQ